jgi:hypothetical protein
MYFYYLFDKHIYILKHVFIKINIDENDILNKRTRLFMY